MAFGVAQQVGASGVFGLNMMSMSFGDIPLTTENSPDASGGIGTFAPTYMNIGVSYSKIFSNSIYGGVQMKIISESIDNLSAQGVAIDAGVQYVTGPEDNIRFGITLRNWGTKLSFTGDGIAIRVSPPGQEDQFTLEQRSAAYELPSQMNIGGAYDFIFDKHTVTLAGNFRSNAFTADQITAGVEYKLMDYLMLRGAYTYEEGIDDAIDSGNRFTVDNGLSGGMTVQIPLNKETGTTFAVDYAFRSTEHFDNTHSIGARVTF
jgi:opacity protein-like surface antigen